MNMRELIIEIVSLQDSLNALEDRIEFLSVYSDSSQISSDDKGVLFQIYLFYSQLVTEIQRAVSKAKAIIESMDNE